MPLATCRPIKRFKILAVHHAAMLYVFMYRLPLSNEHGCLPIGVTRIELWLNTYVVLLRLTIATPEISARTILKRPDDYRSI